MYIIIVGGGEVGYHLARNLLEDGHEIVMVEKDAKKVDLITDKLGSICLHGDGCEAATLREAGAERANIMVAVTDEDEDNLVSCQVAKHKFNVPRTVARVMNPKNIDLFQKLGIDLVISPTRLMLEHIREQLSSRSIVRLLPLEDKQLEMVVVRIPSISPVAGKRIRDILLPEGSLLSLILRKGHHPLLPSDDMVVEAEDRMVVVIKPELESSLLNALAPGREKGK